MAPTPTPGSRSPRVRVAIGVFFVVTLALLNGCGGDEVTNESVVVEVDGLAVAGLQAGDAESSELTVLFLHGGSFTSAVWSTNGLLDAVAAAGHYGVAIDLPGFGKTSATDVAPGQFLADVIGALGRPAHEIVVVSPSRSGSFSLPMLDLQQPVQLGGFVPVAPVGVESFSSERASVAATLVVWGGVDTVIDPEGSAGAEALAARLPGAQVLVIEDGGHAVYNTDSEQFTDALLSFLEVVGDGNEPTSTSD